MDAFGSRQFWLTTFVVVLLSTRADANDTLWTAVRLGDSDDVARILDGGVSPDSVDPDGTPPLVMAALHGHVDVVRTLLEHGASPESQSADGSTALHTAAFLGRAEIAKLLIEHDANVNATNHRGELPLQVIQADWGTTEYIANLLQVKIDRAEVERGRDEIETLLLEQGAERGSSPLLTLIGLLALGLGGVVAIVLLGVVLIIRATTKLPVTSTPIEDVATTAPTPVSRRRHDLDALRAIAMLLGIALHGGLSFTPGIWVAQDTQQNEWFGVAFAAIHGFRMPLFFLLSGFFTAMLWRQRGLESLLWHRSRRVLLPCFVGLFTIVPAVNLAGYVAVMMSRQSTEVSSAIDVQHARRASNPDVLHEGEPGRKDDEGSGTMTFSARVPQNTIELNDVAQIEPASKVDDDEPRAASAGLNGLVFLLTYLPIFHHLWFLWFLCWLVVGFGLFAAACDTLGVKSSPKWLVVWPTRYLWVLPLTMIPQAFMGGGGSSFGPDTSIGLIPQPHILFYYALFFGLGALYFDSHDDDGVLGKWWMVTLPLCLLVIFPIGLICSLNVYGYRSEVGDTTTLDLVGSLLQVTYAWAMAFASIGLFRWLFSHERRWLRYMSDSSYWLYLTHVPLIIIAQAIVRTWPLPSFIKFVFVCTATTGILLFVYHWCVRYTFIGTFLNGPRSAPKS